MVGSIRKSTIKMCGDGSFALTASQQVRDQQTSAALGLPSRIRDEDCEAAELEPSDFEELDATEFSEVFRKPPTAHVNYVIGMAQLAKIC